MSMSVALVFFYYVYVAHAPRAVGWYSIIMVPTIGSSSQAKPGEIRLINPNIHTHTITITYKHTHTHI